VLAGLVLSRTHYPSFPLGPRSFHLAFPLSLSLCATTTFRLFWINASGLAVPKSPLRRFERTSPFERSPFSRVLVYIARHPLASLSVRFPICRRATLCRSVIDAKLAVVNEELSSGAPPRTSEGPSVYNSRFRARFTLPSPSSGLVASASSSAADCCRMTRGLSRRKMSALFAADRNTYTPLVRSYLTLLLLSHIYVHVHYYSRARIVVSFALQCEMPARFAVVRVKL